MNQLPEDDLDPEEEPIRKNRISEPITRKDFVKIMSAITGIEGKKLAILTSHWPKDLRWHYHVQSLCKEINNNPYIQEKEKAKSKLIKDWVYGAKLKEI